jgi:hypothetical protein
LYSHIAALGLRPQLLAIIDFAAHKPSDDDDDWLVSEYDSIQFNLLILI